MRLSFIKALAAAQDAPQTVAMLAILLAAVPDDHLPPSARRR
jgi:hypothetical protein